MSNNAYWTFFFLTLRKVQFYVHHCVLFQSKYSL